MASKTKTFDITLYLIPLILVITGVTMIYSLVYGTNQNDMAVHQATNALIGLVVMAVVGFSDYRFFRGTSWIFYLIGILLLLIVDLFGKTAKGATNWLDLGFTQLQPSELAKVFIIFHLASFFSNKIGKVKWRDIFVSVLITLPVLVLILKEPDLGTALVVACIYLVMLFMAKLSRLQVVAIVGVISIFVGVFGAAVKQIGPFGGLLRDYQRKRITVFLDPASDPKDEGYNVIQAQISVGSGGIYGQGLGHGSQSQLDFLPEVHTDFIFAGISESFGFVGSTVLLLLYLVLLFKVINVAVVAQDNFGALVAFGVAAMLSFQVVINVGMNLGLAPVTGIPLPLLSYGGTSMVVTLFMLGVIQNIFIRHKKLSF